MPFVPTGRIFFLDGFQTLHVRLISGCFSGTTPFSILTVEPAGLQAAVTSSMTADISRYDETFRRLGQEAVACVPNEWTHGRLTMSCDGNSLHYRLKSDSNATPAEATQRLAELCGELYILMEMDGQRWVGCVIEFTRTPGGPWGFDVRFTYPN